jgi:two-component system cell cycle sensor histidine kinase/response regulator CckA
MFHRQSAKEREETRERSFGLLVDDDTSLFRGVDVWAVALALTFAGLCLGGGLALLEIDQTLLSGILFGASVLLGLCAAGYAGVLVPHQARLIRNAYLRSLRRAVASSPTPIVITDRGGHIIHMNETYKTLAGSRTGLLQDILANPEERGRVANIANSAIESDGTSTEFSVMMPDGRLSYYRATAYPFASALGHAVWFLIDVSKLRYAVDEVGRQVANLASFLDQVPLAFLSIDEARRLVFVNRTFADWLGKNRDDILADEAKLEDFVEPVPGNAEVLSLLKDNAAIERATFTLRGTSGAVRPVEIRQHVFKEQGTGRRFMRTILRDIGRERATESELQSAKAHFVNFFEKAPLGIALVNGEGDLIQANDAAETLIGRNGKGGANLLEVVAEDDRTELLRVLNSGTEMRSTMLECKLTGEPERFVQLCLSNIGDQDGASIIYLHETTEQKNLELQFAQSQKMQAVGQLAGGIAHDFNNLLTAILGFSDLLLTRHAAGDPSFTDIMQVKQNANRAASLVRQLLAFSRQQRLNPTVLSITDVLAEVSHLIRRLIGENIKLAISNDRSLSPVKVDQGQLEQVIINLAVNARDAMQGGGTLSIRTKNVNVEESRALGHTLMPPADSAMIEVADTGTGIPKEVMGKIFEPFFTTKEVGQGTGLGLSTVYGIIKQTGGFIFPENLPTGGAAFRIYLPAYLEQGVEAPKEAPPETRHAVRDLTGRGTILLVEDEDAVRLFAARALQNKGYNVLEARSGEAALEIVNTHEGPIQLMVSDVVMPQMDGPTLLKHAREKRPDMKIIFISGYAENAFAKNLEKIDFTFLPKPFSLKKLAETVKDVLSEEMV